MLENRFYPGREKRVKDRDNERSRLNSNRKLHLVPAGGGRGFGLQAEVFHFRASWLEARRPGDRRHVPRLEFPFSNGAAQRGRE